MTRIVAGTHRGRPLAVPPGEGTRPTADRAREALFSSLQSLLDLEDAEVLDLYAGSGALGLEALSRGAARAVLVDSAPAAVAVLTRNAAGLDLPGEVVALPVETFLQGPPRAYDLVLLDPPYDLDVTPVLGALAPWVRPGGIVVAERASRGAALVWPEELEAVRDRRYGAATLWFGRRRGPGA